MLYRTLLVLMILAFSAGVEQDGLVTGPYLYASESPDLRSAISPGMA
jgi:hypothetical protein